MTLLFRVEFFTLLLFSFTNIFAFTATIIDNMEDGDHYNEMGYSWYSVTDKTSGGNSQIYISTKDNNIVMSGEGFNSDKSMHFTYKLDKGDYEWNPRVEVICDMAGKDSTYNASEFQGISYHYIGSGHSFRAHMKSVTDYNFHCIDLPATDVWTEVVINMRDDLYQGQWGNIFDFDPSEIERLSWRIEGKTGDSGKFLIDSIVFLDTIVEEKQYDLEIKDALIPELLEIKNCSTITNPLHAKAMKYLNKGVNLSHWLEAKKFTTFDMHNEKTIKRYAEQGFKSIRFPIDLDLYVKEKDKVVSGQMDFELDSLLFTPLDSLVKWTGRYGLSLTIDYHQYDGSITQSSVADLGFRSMVAQVWKTVAQRYADNPREDIFYELGNEPGISEAIPNNLWEDMALEIIDSIRSVDTAHTLIYGPSRWYDISVLCTTSPLPDKNIIYAFHFYDPMLFTIGSGFSGMGRLKNIPFPYTKEEWSTEYSFFGVKKTIPNWLQQAFHDYYKNGNENAMKNELIRVKNWAIDNNMAIICNEFGVILSNTSIPSTLTYHKTVTSLFKELEIPWQVWFGMWQEDGELLSGLEPILDETSIIESDLTISDMNNEITFRTIESTICFNLKKESKISISLADFRGRIIWRSNNMTYTAGSHKVQLPNDIYSDNMYIIELKKDQKSYYQKWLSR